jgi:hypothetical protein
MKLLRSFFYRAQKNGVNSRNVIRIFSILLKPILGRIAPNLRKQRCMNQAAKSTAYAALCFLSLNSPRYLLTPNTIY